MPTSHAVLRLRRTGGLAGVATEAVIDTAQIDAGEAGEVLAALDAADLPALAGRPPPPPGAPDTFNYTLEVERGAATHRIVLGEADVPQGLRPVLSALSRRSH